MSFADPSSPYEILEISPDATPQEIRAAYLRAKTAYKKDSVALYSLLSEEETHDILEKIEEAYLILSTPERRREYDRHHGYIDNYEDATELGPPAEVVSIDRVPPMESGASEEDILIAPATDFPLAGEHKSAPAVPPPPPTGISSHRTIGAAPQTDDEMSRAIVLESEWRGSFLKQVREYRRISLEELAEFTKINKNYLTAIEEEHFGRLPASVYVRGFIAQIARTLKLPPDPVVNAFMARFTQSRGSR